MRQRLERTVEVERHITNTDYTVMMGDITVLKEAGYRREALEERKDRTFIKGYVGSYELDIIIKKEKSDGHHTRVCKVSTNAPNGIAQRTLDAITIYYALAQSEEWD